jgi:sn-glycerol 3-phosphate transport system substrate-binding protein
VIWRTVLCTLAALAFVDRSPAQAAAFELWHGLNGSARAALDDACDRFNRSQSSDRITCVGLGSYEVALQRTAAAYRAGRQPALVHVFDAATQEMIQSGASVGLDRPDRLQPAAVRRFYVGPGGRLYAQPYNASTLLLYANRDLLARAGVAALPETWETFEADAWRLRRAGVVCPFATRLEPWWWLEQMNDIAGAPVASEADGEGGLGARFVFAGGVHRRMMMALQRWRREGLAFLFDQSALGSSQSAFLSGRCAMILETSGAAGGLAAVSHGRFQVVAGLTPRFGDIPRHSTAPGGGALWRLKGADAHVAAAVDRFLAFVQRPDEQARFSLATGYLPLSSAARAEVEHARGVSRLQITALRLAEASLDQGAPATDLRLGAYVRFRAIWLEEMQRAFAGSESLDAALQRSQARGDALLARFQKSYRGGGA